LRICPCLLQEQHRSRAPDQTCEVPASNIVAVFLKVIVFHCSRTGTGLPRFRNELSAGTGAPREDASLADPLGNHSRFQVVMRIVVGLVDSPSAETMITNASKASTVRFTTPRLYQFFHCRGESKRRRIRRVNYWQTLAIVTATPQGPPVSDCAKSIVEIISLG
jgi:hypothetical protein